MPKIIGYAREPTADQDPQLQMDALQATGSVRSSTPLWRMVCTVTVTAAVATLEAEIISERTKAGLAAARSQGREGGRPTVMTEERRW